MRQLGNLPVPCQLPYLSCIMSVSYTEDMEMKVEVKKKLPSFSLESFMCFMIVLLNCLSGIISIGVLTSFNLQHRAGSLPFV